MNDLASTKNSIDSCIKWIRKVQNPDGGLPSDREGSHSCTWTTSGLIWASWVGGASFRELYMRKALRWVCDNRNQDYGIPIVVTGDHSITDATAQTVIAASFSLIDIKDELVQTTLDGCVKWLIYHRLGDKGWNWRPSSEPSWIASSVFAILGLYYCQYVLNSYKSEVGNLLISAVDWLKEIRNKDGGWGAYEGDKSRPAITGLVCSLFSELDKEYDISKSIDFILSEQHANGSWSDTIDRPTGHTVTRIGTPNSIRGLADCGFPIESREFQNGLAALFRAFDHGRFRYRDTDILSWPTRDNLLALVSVGKRLGFSNCRTIVDKNVQNERDLSAISLTSPRIQSLPGSSVFRLELRLESDLTAVVSCFDTPLGEALEAIKLPYSFDELTTIIKALDLRKYDPHSFTEDQIQILNNLGLINKQTNQFSENIFQIIGLNLYSSFFTGDISDAFRMAFNQARQQRHPLHLQFRFLENTTSLARYPWELLFDGRRHLVSGGAVELTRYISYPEALTTLSITSPLNILVVTSRPQNLTLIPEDDEWIAIQSALSEHEKRGEVILERLSHTTYDNLREKLEDGNFQILHLDGHGVLARRCPVCGEMHYPHVKSCVICKTSIESVSSKGFFAFEDEDGNADFVDSIAIQNLIIVSNIQIAVVSACQTSTLREGSIFGGFGPGMIQAGVPAIIAMQLSLNTNSAKRFASSFYGGLTKGISLPGSVAAGRKALFREGEWFIPTLWLRC